LLKHIGQGRDGGARVLSHRCEVDRVPLRDAQPLLNTLKEQPNALIFKRSAQDPTPKGSR